MLYLENYNGFDAYADLRSWKTALKNGDIITVEKMIKSGFNINTKFTENNFKSITALSFAFFYDQYDVVKLLIKNDINLDVFAPTYDMYLISYMVIKYYISSDIVKNDILSILNLMIKKGADVNLINKDDGDTALILAAKYTINKIIYILIDAGANWNIMNKYGQDFIDIIGDFPFLFKKYPTKYREYIKKKTSSKFNL
jgi:ankyrin repeat protein